MKVVMVKKDKYYIPGLSVVRDKAGDFCLYYSDSGKSAWGNLDWYDSTPDFESKEMTCEEITDYISRELTEISERFKSGDFSKNRETNIVLRVRLRRICDNNLMLLII